MQNHLTHTALFIVCLFALGLNSSGCSDEGPNTNPSVRTIVTIPKPDNEITSSVVGKPCEKDKDCEDGLICDLSMPDGHCTTKESCQAESCPKGAGCAQTTQDGPLTCFQNCVTSEDCRDGYICAFQRANHLICLPEPTKPAYPEPVSAQTLEDLLEVDCQPEKLEDTNIKSWNAYRWTVEIPADAKAVIFAPYAKKGKLSIASLESSQQSTDLLAEYKHHNLQTIGIYGDHVYDDFGVVGASSYAWPFYFPYAPQFRGLFLPGESYTFKVFAENESPCLYLATGKPGKVIDINFYFARNSGLSSTYAPLSADFNGLQTAFSKLLAKAGISIGKVRLFDVPGDVPEDILRLPDEASVAKMAAYSSPPGETLDDVLSANVFVVDKLEFGQGLILGITAALPGMPGMHGNAGNGVIISTTDLGYDNGYVAHILAHELGHLLGLRHTTEILNGSGAPDEAVYEEKVDDKDPFEDTPLCDNVLVQGPACPDYENLMFPAAPDPSEMIDPSISPSQIEYLQNHPLVKEK